ncbi:MAG: hypothetical protein LUH17_04395 [Acidaminococcaceae bacterium]|nr:hypothetical protein [Acidaminococcaceae bacterium]
MKGFLDSFFKLKERDTDWRREVVGGITAFVTMAYIIFVNPQIMSAAGMDPGTVMLATCLASAAGMLLMGLYANAPFWTGAGNGYQCVFCLYLVRHDGLYLGTGLRGSVAFRHYFCGRFCYRSAQQDHCGNTTALKKLSALASACLFYTLV